MAQRICLRCGDRATQVGRLVDARIKRHERDVEELGEGHVACVVGGQVSAKLPGSRRQEFERPMFDREVEEDGTGLGSLVWG